MEERVNIFIEGKRCPRCNGERLYRLRDKRYKCKVCCYKYSSIKLRDDLAIAHYFSLEIPANKAARDLGFSYNKVHNRYMVLRQEIFRYLKEEFKILTGEIECDESYFGGKKKGIRGRGSAGKIKVFGMLERQGRIFTTPAALLTMFPPRH